MTGRGSLSAAASGPSTARRPDCVPFGTTNNPRYAGAIGGGQVGYDYQFGRWVIGVEGALNATNAHGARECPNGVFFSLRRR